MARIFRRPAFRISAVEETMDAASIQAMIETGLPGARAHVQGDDGVHFEAEVVAAQFAGKLPLARRRAPLTVAAAPFGIRFSKDSRWQKF